MNNQPGLILTDKQRALIMLPILISGFMAALNETLLNVAFPQLMTSLNVTTSTLQWLATSYMLVIGIMVPVVAALLKTFSTRKLYLAAMVIFTIGTISGALAQSFPSLLASRIIQGAGAGVLLTMVMSTITEIYPPERRGTAMGIGVMVIIIAPAVGPVLSGIIVQYLSWHWLFYLVLPLVALALVLGSINLKSVTVLTKPRIDSLSIVLSTLGFGGLIFGIGSAEQSGFGDITIWISLITGIAGLVTFVLRQLRLNQPLLEIRTFRFPMFSLGIAIMFITFMIPISVSIILPIYMQRVLELTPLVCGLALLPGNICSLIVAPVAGRIYDKIGSKQPVIIGYLVLIAGVVFLSRISDTTALVLLIVLHCCICIGVNTILIPIQTNTLNQLPREQNPHGAAIMTSAFQIGAAFGSAIFIGLLGAIENNRLAGLTNPDTQQIHSAIASAVGTAFLASLGFIVIGLILAFFIKQKRKVRVYVEEESSKF